MMDRIAVLDFGAQYTQLIARRIRELGVYSEILPCTQPVDDVLAAGYTGIVLSGGPSSVYDDEAPLPDKRLFEAGIPLLGICYGMQAMGYLLGGHVVPAERREYGPAELRLLSTEGLLEGIVPERDGRIAVWMSHGDTVMQPPRGFVNLGTTENCPVAAMADDTRRLFAVQFHPEVAHTPQGKTSCETSSASAARGPTGRCPRSSTPPWRVSAVRSAGIVSCAPCRGAWTRPSWPS